MEVNNKNTILMRDHSGCESDGVEEQLPTKKVMDMFTFEEPEMGNNLHCNSCL